MDRKLQIVEVPINELRVSEYNPRKHVPRTKAVQEVKRGNHPDAHIYKRNHREYVRDNPDHSKRDNVNRNKG